MSSYPGVLEGIPHHPASIVNREHLHSRQVINDAVILITGVSHPARAVPFPVSASNVLLTILGLDDEPATDGRVEFSGVNSFHAIIIS